jgi:hypothetical protein
MNSPLSPSPVDSAKGEVSATVTVSWCTSRKTSIIRHIRNVDLPMPAIWRNHVSPTKTPISEDPSLETLRDMAARTGGYWARDYSLQLGWNNMRDYST